MIKAIMAVDEKGGISQLMHKLTSTNNNQIVIPEHTQKIAIEKKQYQQN